MVILPGPNTWPEFDAGLYRACMVLPLVLGTEVDWQQYCVCLYHTGSVPAQASLSHTTIRTPLYKHTQTLFGPVSRYFDIVTSLTHYSQIYTE